jgi:hypothetical protein
LEKLNDELYTLIYDRLDGNEIEELNKNVQQLQSVYPFNDFEYKISTLAFKQKISYEEYLSLRNKYIKRNKNLYLYQMAPRTFGEVWGENHLINELPLLQKPYNNLGYDLSLFYQGFEVRIEVKSSRGVTRKSGSSLVEKSLYSYEMENIDFVMNFQQLKPSLCDVFIWIGVFKDEIYYWVLSSKDIENHPNFSSQHRTAYKTTKIFEGQIMITNKNYKEFEKYRLNIKNMYNAIIEKFIN